MDDGKQAFLRAIGVVDEETETAINIAPDIEAIRLRDSLRSFQTKYDFQVGDIVRQKHGCRLYKKFGSNDHCIVIELLKEKIITGLRHEGSPHFREPNDMIVGAIEYGKESRESFCLFHVDSRRFEPVPVEEIRLRGSLS